MVHTWKWRLAFTSLSNRYFRWLWLGSLASSATFQMSSVAQGWLVYKLTGSAFALGWVSAGWSLSTLVLSLYGGVICDRMDRRSILLIARAGMVLNSVVLAVLISTGTVCLWHLAVSSLLTGILFAFLMPAQQAFLADLVDRETLLNANSLNAIGMGLMGIFASSLAGAMIESLGVGSVYYAMAGLYLVSLLTIAQLPAAARVMGQCRSVWRDLREGVSYIVGNRPIMLLLLLALSRVLVGMPYRTLMPKYAQDVLGLDASGLGVLLAAPGAGSMISALLLATLGDFRNKGKLYLLAGLAMGLGLVAFGQTPVLAIGLLALGLVGATSNVCMVINQTLLQSYAGEQYRGRVMSVYMMMWGLTPLGTIPAGAAADAVGVAAVLTAQGLLLAAFFVLLRFLSPQVRQMK